MESKTCLNCVKRSVCKHFNMIWKIPTDTNSDTYGKKFSKLFNSVADYCSKFEHRKVWN